MSWQKVETVGQDCATSEAAGPANKIDKYIWPIKVYSETTDLEDIKAKNTIAVNSVLSVST